MHLKLEEEVFGHSVGLIGYEEYNVSNGGDGSKILVLLEPKVYVNTENADIIALEMEGISGFYLEKDTLNYLCFEKDGIYIYIYIYINIRLH